MARYPRTARKTRGSSVRMHNVPTTHLSLYHHVTTFCISRADRFRGLPTGTHRHPTPNKSHGNYPRLCSSPPQKHFQRSSSGSATGVDRCFYGHRLSRLYQEPRTMADRPTGIHQWLGSGRFPSIHAIINPLTPVLRQVLDTLSPELDIHKRCLRALRKACGIYGLLPASYRVPFGLTTVTVNKRPVASSGFADVWMARSRDNQTFAVKHIRIYEVDNLDDMTKVLRFRYPALVRIFHWKSLPRDTAKGWSPAGE